MKVSRQAGILSHLLGRSAVLGASPFPPPAQYNKQPKP
jgi:hypothetical protein